MVTSTALFTNAATVNQANAPKAALPGGIKRYEEESAKPKASGAANTQQDFLKPPRGLADLHHVVDVGIRREGYRLHNCHIRCQFL